MIKVRYELEYILGTTSICQLQEDPSYTRIPLGFYRKTWLDRLLGRAVRVYKIKGNMRALVYNWPARKLGEKP